MEPVLIDLGIKSTLLVAICLAALWVARRGSASARHILLLAGMAALLALPALEVVLPRWQVPAWVQQVELGRSTEAAGADISAAALPVPLWVAVWLAGALALSVRWLLGLRAISKVRRGSSLPSEELRSRIEGLLVEAGSCSELQIVLGASEISPMTWGWRRPVLALPSGAEDWPEDRLRAVVLHEAAHIERGDWLSQQMGRMGCVLYWFHPGVWLVARQMARESEHAADDRVLSLGCAPEEYAEHLVEVARCVRFARNHPAVAMARQTPILDRLQAVLALGRNRTPMAGWAKAGLFVVCAALAVVVAAAGPTIVVHSAPIAQAPPKPEGPLVSVTSTPVQLTADNFVVGPAPDASTDSNCKGSDSSKSSGDSADSNCNSDTSASDDNQSADDPSDTSSTDGSADQAQADQAAKPDVTQATEVARASDEKVSEKVSEALAEAKKEVAMAERQMQGKVSLGGPQTLDKTVPEIKVDTPDIEINAGNFHLQVPGVHVHVPTMHIHVPPIHVDAPSSNEG